MTNRNEKYIYSHEECFEAGGFFVTHEHHAAHIEALERENARLRDINAILEDCMSKGMVIRKKETE